MRYRSESRMWHDAFEAVPVQEHAVLQPADAQTLARIAAITSSHEAARKLRECAQAILRQSQSRA